MSVITQAIRNAEEISSPGISSTADSLTLTVSDPASNPLTFSLTDGVVMVSAGLNSSVALTNSNVQASDLQFRNLSRTGTPGNVQVTFTLTRLSDSPRHEYDYTRTFSGSASLR